VCIASQNQGLEFYRNGCWWFVSRKGLQNIKM
jgi:hypothetical protein